MLIGISGLKRTGKDTSAKYIRHLCGLNGYAFADPLKQAAMHMFNISRTMAYGLKGYDREQIVPEWGISVRDMLQKLGTECAREIFYENFWLIRAESELSFNPAYRNGAVISDVRFDNEALWIKSKGGLVINIVKSLEQDLDDHASEQGISPRYITHTVLNDGSIDDLYDKLSEIIKSK